MEIIYEAVKNEEATLFTCTGYNDSCWCNDVACQGQND